MKLVRFILNDQYRTEFYINPLEVETIMASTRQTGLCYINTKTKQSLEVCCDASEAYKILYDVPSPP